MRPPTASKDAIYHILDRQLSPEKPMGERLSYFFYHGLTKTTISESAGGLGFNVAVVFVTVADPIRGGVFRGNPRKLIYQWARGTVDGEEWAAAVGSCSSKGLLEHIADADERLYDKTAIDARLSGRDVSGALKIDANASSTMRNIFYGSASYDDHFILDPRDAIVNIVKKRGIYLGDAPHAAISPIGNKSPYYGVVVAFNPYSGEDVSENLDALRGLWRKKGDILPHLKSPEKEKAAVEELAALLSMSKQELAMLAHTSSRA